MGNEQEELAMKKRVGNKLVGKLLAMTVVALAASGVYANDAYANETVQVPSLEVKARIASMEEVNVTAEKSIDPDAPAPSAGVAQLLLELEAIENETNAPAEQADD